MSFNNTVTPPSFTLTSPPPVVNPRDESKFTIHKYSSLDEKMQRVAREAIANLNKTISTDEGKTTWEEYTGKIYQRIADCKNARNTLFVAFDQARAIGYAAFYTKQDKVPYPNKFLGNDNEAYLSWVGLDENYRGKGIGQSLERQIFEPEHNVHTFKFHVKKTNEPSLGVFHSFEKKGYPTTKELLGHQFFCTVTKK